MAANNLLDRYSYPYKDAGVPIICESMDTDKETELRDFSCIVVEKHIGYLSLTLRISASFLMIRRPPRSTLHPGSLRKHQPVRGMRIVPPHRISCLKAPSCSERRRHGWVAWSPLSCFLARTFGGINLTEYHVWAERASQVCKIIDNMQLYVLYM